MINYRTIYKIIGSLLFIEAALMLSCLAMAIYYAEDDVMAFLVSIIATLFFGFVFRFMGRNSNNTMGRRDACLVVSLSWAIFSAIGTMPFMIGGYLHSFTDAYFETMSGFTTTGATIIDDVEALPHGIIFWRSLTQWIGGLGIVFFTIALLPSLVGGSVKVFSAEATGPIKSKLHPKLSTSAKAIWAVYLTISIACTLCYKFLGMGWFDSVNYSMTSLATGGFSTHNSSVEFFHSPAIEYAVTFFCFISGVNFTLLYFTATKLKIRQLFRNSEFKLYLWLVLGFTAFIMVELIIRNHYELEKAFRAAIFQVVSFITTTGLFSDDAARWPHVTWVVLAMCMFIGACSGSTSGGFKCIRFAVEDRRRKRLYPKARNVTGLPHRNIGDVFVLCFLHDCSRNRQHQRHNHHTKCAKQRWTNVGNRDWPNHVVGTTARLCQVAVLSTDAHGTLGDIHRIGYLHPRILERQIVLRS